ncbi:MAG: PDZ domain-containing protein [Pyrinomonadaceae bacterium]
MSNQNLQNKIEDEILSVEDGKLRQMIKSLRRVNAPKDFDFRLKARIANTQPNEFQPRFLPVLRYVLPLSVVVLVFTFVIINGVYFADNKQIAETVPQTPIENKITPTNDSQIAPPDLIKVPVQSAPNSDFADLNQPKIQLKSKETIPVREPKFVVVKFPKKPQTELPKKKIIDGGGSRDSAVSPPIIITPNGIPSNDTVGISPNTENANSKTAEQILLPLGIETVSENGKLRIKTVKRKSIAERSGVQVGDLIEAIDGEKLSDGTIRTKTIEGKQITVVRGTEKIKISLHD